MLDIPAALKTEHENLHGDLSAAIKVPGQTGQGRNAGGRSFRRGRCSEAEVHRRPVMPWHAPSWC